MTEPIFVDTNILIYAYDIDAGSRHQSAKALIKELWQSGNGVISIQVLQEFYVNITCKIPEPLPRHHARGLVETYSAWKVITPNFADVLKASEIEARYALSFWDAMILSAAFKAGASTVWTEDLSDRQMIEGIRILNPLGVPSSR